VICGGTRLAHVWTLLAALGLVVQGLRRDTSRTSPLMQRLFGRDDLFEALGLAAARGYALTPELGDAGEHRASDGT
jgi:hypothetical protein